MHYDSKNYLVELVESKTQLDEIKNELVWDVREMMPKPASEMVLGLVLGINQLYFIPDFRDMLKDTGTIHVVVVSGFNISLVSNLVLKFFKKFTDLRVVISTIFLTAFYSVITGFDPPIVRALIMFVFLILGKYFGRVLNVLYILFLSAAVMLAINPTYLVSLSFQLSFAATLGLILYGDFLGKFIKSKSVFVQDFLATLSAQLFVWPLLAYNFYTVNVLGLLVNSLVLWIIPIATILGFVFMLLLLLSTPLAYIFSIPLGFLISIFINTVDYFSSYSYLNVEYAPSKKIVLLYYIIIIFIPYLHNLFTAKQSRI